jgi:hypothetical protein
MNPEATGADVLHGCIGKEGRFSVSVWLELETDFHLGLTARLQAEISTSLSPLKAGWRLKAEGQMPD